MCCRWLAFVQEDGEAPDARELELVPVGLGPGQRVREPADDVRPRVRPVVLAIARRGPGRCRGRRRCRRRRSRRSGRGRRRERELLELAQHRERTEDDSRRGRLSGEVQAQHTQRRAPRAQAVAQRVERVRVGGHDGFESRETYAGAEGEEEAKVLAAEARARENDGAEVRAGREGSGVDADDVGYVLVDAASAGLAGDVDLDVSQRGPRGGSAQEVRRAQHVPRVCAIRVPHDELFQTRARGEGGEERGAHWGGVVAVLYLDAQHARAHAQDPHEVLHPFLVLPSNTSLQPQPPHQATQLCVPLQGLAELSHKHLPAPCATPRVIIHRQIRDRPIALRQAVDVRVVEVREAAERAAEGDGGVEAARDERVPGAADAQEGREWELREVGRGGDGLLDEEEDVVHDLGWEFVDGVHHLL